MSQTQPQAEQEIGLDDFEMEVPKAVGVFKPEAIEEKVDQKNANGLTGYTKIEQKVVDELDQEVERIAKELMTTPADTTEFKDITAALNRMGDAEIKKTSNLSNVMLTRRSIRSMKDNDYGEGNEVAKNLTNLRKKVTELDPKAQRQVFSKNKLLGFLPFGVGRKIDDYFQGYKNAQSYLDDILNSLEHGKDQLMEDNAYIAEDQSQMRDMMQRLEQYAYVMKRLDKKIEDRLPQIEAEDKMKAEDIRQEILFPIRQKRMDILQHLAVSMQGSMALQVLLRNNKELIRGVERAKTTTMAALRTAIVVSEALSSQKLVLDQIGAMNEVTNRLIESTSEQLGKQGVEIQKQATESAVNVETLEKAFQNIFKAMDAMDSYRAQALPNMQKTVESLEKTIDNAKNYLSSRRADRIGNFADEVLKSDEPKKGAAVKIR